MRISGFTIIRNAILNDYPILEAIRSVLPVVDEMIVLVGESNDETLLLIESIADPKIKIHHSVWEMKPANGENVLAVETNKAFRLIDPGSDWAFYIQADEVIHEKYHETIVEACKRYKDDLKVEGLLFKWLHFYGTYDYVGDSRRWYNHEVRILRNDSSIKAYRDAQGFRKNGEKLKVKLLNASVYHYGWVKSPESMQQKIKNVARFLLPEVQAEEVINGSDYFDFNQFDSLQKFEGTHPAVMQQRIANKNFLVELDIQKKRFSLKEKILYRFEKMTGKRLFDYKNYRILK
ncbi:MAG: glycosyltransferase family 2 protein [Chitinophagaceae bacterium]|nr:glycosyltransferase family 2 protein [Chitinophagaceae bacterium]